MATSLGLWFVSFLFPGFWFERHEQQDGEPVSEASQVDGSLLDVVVVVVTLVPC